MFVRADVVRCRVCPIYAVAFVCVAVTGYFSDQHPTQRGAIIAAWLSVSMTCSIIVCVVYGFTARYVEYIAGA